MKEIGGGVALGIAFRELIVAIGAEPARAGGKHLVVRFFDGVIAVALAAFGPTVLIEGLFMFAAVEEAGVGRMAKAATVAHARDARRRGRVVPMAIITGGRAEIAALEQGAAMRSAR